MNLKKSFLFVALLTFGITMVCYGQAWIPPKGMAAIAINYQYIQVESHIGSLGEQVKAGEIFANSVIADFSYSITDKLALSVNLPFITSKYDGPGPHKILNADGTFTIPIDDGTYHSTFQDFTFQGRYNIASNPMQITPFVRVTIPSHDYEWFAHAAAGVRQRRLQFGTYLGRVLDPVIPNAYFQVRYGFTFHEKILDISRNSSNLDLELGYFVTPGFRVFGLAVSQYSHGGLDMSNINPKVSTNPYFFNHDRITRYNSFNVGGGASYTISNAIDVYGALTNTQSGRNGHAVKYGLTFGMSYGFQGWRPPRDNMQASNTLSRDSKAVCLCALKENGMR
jgi:hypothetical protein